MEGKRWRAAVVTLSDKGYAGEREDKSGPLICDMLGQAGYEVVETGLLPDEIEEIKKYLYKLCDEIRVDIIFTTGGTGLSPRDCTPEATLAVATRNVPGIGRGHAPGVSADYAQSYVEPGRVSDPERDTDYQSAREARKRPKRIWEAVLPSLDHGLAVLTGRTGECGHEPVEIK